MEWLFGLAVLPLLLCGAMCAGGALLAFLGIRRAQQPSCHGAAPSRHAATPDEAGVERH